MHACPFKTRVNDVRPDGIAAVRLPHWPVEAWMSLSAEQSADLLFNLLRFYRFGITERLLLDYIYSYVFRCMKITFGNKNVNHQKAERDFINKKYVHKYNIREIFYTYISRFFN